MAQSNTYTKTYTSFSGADIVATITPHGGRPQVFAELQTISYSIYRPTQPVYALGRINPKGVVRGQRTIAGSLIFTVFDRHVLTSMIDSFNHTQTSKGGGGTFNLSGEELKEMKINMKTDEMPPFDVNITFLNEYGQSSTLNIRGIHILSEGQTMSIEDMITENTMQYIATDINLMQQGKL